MHNITKYILAATVAATAFCAAAQQTKPGATVVDQISEYLSPNTNLKTPPHFTYMPDGTSYALLSDDGKTIDTYDLRTGNKTGTILDLGHVRETQVSSMSGFIISPDASRILIYRNRESIYRRSYTAEYYVYEVRSRILLPLSVEHKRAQIPVFSPNSRMIAFVADNDVYLKKLDYNTEVAVTTDGAKNNIINGATDWTYEEEFYLTSTLTWSSDSETLCFAKFNESKVREYTLPLYEGTCERNPEYALYPGLMEYKYPVAGETNSTVTLHSYDIDTRKTIDLTIPDTDIEYFPRLDFIPNGDRLLVSTLNRDQNHYRIYAVNPKANVAKNIYDEKSKAWIIPDAYEQLSIETDGFVVMSNRDGHTQLYRYAYTGALTSTLTSGDADVTAYYGADAAGNRYYQAAAPRPIDRTVYRIDAKKRTVSAVSPTDGTSSAQFSPRRDYAVMSYSNTTTPTRHTLVSSLGKELRTLADNSDVAQRFASKMVDKEFTQIESDGLMLNAFIMRPKDFNASNKYPVVMTQYSGPGSQSVLNRWEMGWEQFFVNNGFIVVCVDGRGTGGRGSDFMYKVYKNLGYYETIDQINAAAKVAQLPGVDAKRIGMFGWSYGGYETLMCLTDARNPFAAGVAVAPVTDWRFYDTVYAERYMLTPQQNNDGYQASAPLSRSKSLTGNTLIMYGTADDNVHPANSLQFVSAVQTNGMWCDMLVFPNKNHSIYGCGARAVVYGRMFEYFKKNL